MNFRFPDDAMEFKSTFSTHLFFPADQERSGLENEDGVSVKRREPIQGFASNFDQYMRSYLTHSPRLPPQFKPTLVRSGKAIPFPEPWAEIKMCRGTYNFIKKLERYQDAGEER
jgi:hypothetical protein